MSHVSSFKVVKVLKVSSRNATMRRTDEKPVTKRVDGFRRFKGVGVKISHQDVL